MSFLGAETLKQSLPDRERQRLQSLQQLDTLKTPSARNRAGQFATPPALAKSIIRASLSLMRDHDAIRYLEPGFGTGPFYSALLRSDCCVIAARGIESDPVVARAARRIWAGTGLRLTAADFAGASAPKSAAAKYNLVVCNPPYVRHHHLDSIQKRDLHELVLRRRQIKLSRLAGLHIHFLLLSIDWMAPAGVAAWLIPAEFMDVNYGQEVKRFLLDHVTLQRIHRFDASDVQFDDALVSSVVIWFQHCPPSSRHPVQLTSGPSLQRPAVRRQVDRALLARTPKWSTLFCSSVESRKPGPTVADLFVVRRGIATGCNRFFILAEDQAKELGIPNRFLQPILPSPRYLAADLIARRRDGTPDLSRQSFLLNCSWGYERIEARHPQLARYLTTGIADKVDQRYLCRHRSPWYAQEQRQAAPFLLTYMGRGRRESHSPLRFICNQSDAIAPNVYLMLYPRDRLAKLMAQNSNLQLQVFDRLQAISPASLTGQGRLYGGGLYKLEPKELARVSIEGCAELIE